MLIQPLEQEMPLEALIRRPILIVDDDTSLAEVLSVRLSRQGFETLTAHDGQQALSLAYSEKPSLILLDLGLPDVDGLDLCERLVDDPLTCEIPVIIVSGHDDPSIVHKARRAGCSFFIRKPFDPSALLILIERAIDDACQP